MILNKFMFSKWIKSFKYLKNFFLSSVSIYLISSSEYLKYLFEYSDKVAKFIFSGIFGKKESSYLYLSSSKGHRKLITKLLLLMNSKRVLVKLGKFLLFLSS